MMKKRLAKLIMVLVAATAMSGAALAAPDVVVSIKPIHSLVASIMKDVAEPAVILKGAGSPHTYQMTPADATTLQNADIVFWVGPSLEKFLEKPLESLGEKAKRVALAAAPGLAKLPTRESGTFEPHADEEPGEEEEFDPHLWLNTDNAKAIAAEITTTLATADPDNALKYQQNQAALDSKLDALASEIKTTLIPVKDKPFIVFHDAYQYFEKEFGVNVAGSITVTPENVPGAARISEIHEKVKTLGASCVFSEPQFESKLVDVVLEGTQSKTGTLDPEAATLTAGPALYFEMMRGIAGSLKTCLLP